MARNRRGKMALYEVMSKAKERPGYKRTLENIRTGRGGEVEPIAKNEESVVAETTVETDTEHVSAEIIVLEGHEDTETSGLSVQWRRKPRVVQYNHGRVEFSVPYQIGIAAALGLVVVMLLAFRVGQRSVVVEPAGGSIPPVNAGQKRQDPVVGGNEGVQKETSPTKVAVQGSGNIGVATTTSSNAIVLVQYSAERDLVPVRAHFASHGIATEIVQSGGVYFLITQDRYDSVKSGDGYLAKERITEVGSDYKGKAPAGYETFGPRYFSDAYGKKVE